MNILELAVIFVLTLVVIGLAVLSVAAVIQ